MEERVVAIMTEGCVHHSSLLLRLFLSCQAQSWTSRLGVRTRNTGAEARSEARRVVICQLPAVTNNLHLHHLRRVQHYSSQCPLHGKRRVFPKGTIEIIW
jgi:hypothetical protein